MIELKKITKAFDKLVLLENADLSLPDTGLFLIVGENGIGKTTLLYIIGLLDHRFQGEYFLENENVKNLSKSDIKLIREKDFSFVFSKHNLIPYLSVKENLTVGLNDNLSDFKLPINQNPLSLSGGEEVILAIQHEKALNKKIYLFDEVTSSLDDNHLEEIINLFYEMAKEHLLLIVSHDRRIEKIGQKIVIKNKKIVVE